MDVTCASWDLEGQWPGSQRDPHEKISGPHQWWRPGDRKMWSLHVGLGPSGQQLLPVSWSVSDDHSISEVVFRQNMFSFLILNFHNLA